MRVVLKLDTFFVVASFLTGVMALTLSHYQGNEKKVRVPSGSSSKVYELHLQKLALSEVSRLKDHENVFLRATFDKEQEVEFGKGEAWTLSRGDQIDLDIKMDIDNRWIKNDQLEFKLELMHKQWFTTTLVRCSQISKELSSYNRSYQCFIPGEKTPLLTYRLAEKGSPAPKNLPIASK